MGKFAELSVGESFLYQGFMWCKLNTSEAQRLTRDGEVTVDIQTIPSDATVEWI